jgi:hypothetical protein
MRYALMAVLLLAAGSPAADQQEGDVVQPSGKWCARMDSANGDGYFSACVLTLTQGRNPGTAETRAFAWLESVCTKDKSWCGDSWGKTRVVGGPEKLTAIPGGLAFDAPQNIVGFPQGSPAQIRVAQRDGKVALEGGEGPSQDTLVWERDEGFGNIRPSFLCAKAHQPREMAICRSPSLSYLDQQLTITFARVLSCSREAVKPSRTATEIQQSQAKWWNDKLAPCQSAECVEPLYRERMAELNRMCPQK